MNKHTPSASETFAFEAAFAANQLFDQAEKAADISEAIELVRQSGLLQEMAGIVFAPPEPVNPGEPGFARHASAEWQTVPITASTPSDEYLPTLKDLPFTKHARSRLINVLGREGLITLRDVLTAGRTRFNAMDRMSDTYRNLVTHLMLNVTAPEKFSLFWPDNLDGTFAAHLYEDLNHVPGGVIDVVLRDHSLQDVMQLDTIAFEELIDEAIISGKYPELIARYKQGATARPIIEDLSQKIYTFTSEFAHAKNS